MAPGFILLALFLYIPLFMGVVMAFQNYNMFNLTDLHFIGLENFTAIITDKTIDFWQILINTAVWLFFSLLFQFWQQIKYIGTLELNSIFQMVEFCIFSRLLHCQFRSIYAKYRTSSGNSRI